MSGFVAGRFEYRRLNVRTIKNPAGLHQRGFFELREGLLGFFKRLSFRNNISSNVLWARHIV